MILFISLCLIALLYWYSTRTFSYWKQRGVVHDPPLPGLGNNACQLFRLKTISQTAADLYQRYPNEKVVGYYKFTQPELVIRDPELIRNVLSTDFAHFHARIHIGGENREQLEPLRRHMALAEGKLWRLLRQGCSPAFTVGKLKAMFPLILERAERLQQLTLLQIQRGSCIDAKDLMGRFNMDFIGACGLGIEARALDDDNSPFRKLVKEMFKLTPRDVIIHLIKELFPGTLKLKYFRKLEEYFLNLVRELQTLRNNKPSDRHDFVDVLMEMKSKGKIQVEFTEKEILDGTEGYQSIEVDDAFMAAQVFMFLGAGFETSAMSTSFTLHELAFNPEKQVKAQKEIDQVLSKHGHKLSWEAIKEMQYLDWAYKEGLRKLPPIAVFGRICRRKYHFSNLNFSIDEGVRVRISIQALHKDPAYWDNPEEFRPERFSPAEYNEARMKQVYLPFGLGPRACIGERLGLMQSLAGLATILSRFTVEPAPNSLRDPIIDPTYNFSQNVIGGLPLIFKERKMLPQ